MSIPAVTYLGVMRPVSSPRLRLSRRGDRLRALLGGASRLGLVALPLAAAGPMLATSPAQAACTVPSQAITFNLDANAPCAVGGPPAVAPPGTTIDTAGATDAVTEGPPGTGFVWTLDNQGTLSGGDDGVEFFDPGSSLVNGGSVIGETNNGVVLNGDNSSVDNSGSLVGQGGFLSAGINAPINGLTVVNRVGGSITSGGNGIRFNSNANITNAGTIRSPSAAIIGGLSLTLTNQAGGIIDSDFAQSVEATSGMVTNQVGGTIIGQNEAIAFRDPSTVINAGTLTSEGGPNVIFMRSAGTVINSGTIEVLTPFGESAIHIGAGFVTGGGTVTNLPGGTIIGGALAGRPALQLRQGAYAVTNAATITGLSGTAIQFNDVFNDTLVLQTGSVLNGNADAGPGTGDLLRLEGTGTEDSTFLNFEQLTMLGQRWTYTGASTITNTDVEQGRLDINGTLTTSAEVVAGGILGGTGTIVGPVANPSGVVAPGTSIGTFNIAGPFTQGPNGTLEVEVNRTASDLLNITGTAALDGTVAAQFLEFDIPEGATYLFLEATAGRTGTFSQVTDNALFLEPQVVYTPTQAFLVIGRTPFTSVAETENQRAVSGALDTAVAGGATGFGPIIVLLNQGTVADARGLFDVLSGDPLATLTWLGLRSMDRHVESTAEHMAELRDGTAPAGGLSFDGALLAYAGDLAQLDLPPEIRGGLAGGSVWARGYGVFGEIDDDGNAGAVDYDVGGLSAGLDVRIRPDAVAGLSFGYARTDAAFEDRSAEGDIDAYAATLYGTGNRGPAYAEAVLGYAFNDFEAERVIPGAGTAEADYDGHAVLAHGEVGYRLAPPQLRGWELVPLAGLHFVGLWQEDFAESGAGAVSLIVEDEEVQSLRSTLGIRATGELPTAWGFRLIPEVRAAWSHEFLDENVALDVAFAGAPAAGFTVQGVETGRNHALLGAGLTAMASETVSVFADYDATLGTSLAAHAVSGGVRVRW